MHVKNVLRIKDWKLSSKVSELKHLCWQIQTFFAAICIYNHNYFKKGFETNHIQEMQGQQNCEPFITFSIKIKATFLYTGKACLKFTLKLIIAVSIKLWLLLCCLSSGVISWSDFGFHLSASRFGLCTPIGCTQGLRLCCSLYQLFWSEGRRIPLASLQLQDLTERQTTSYTKPHTHIKTI